ncbi:MAG: SDR family NAD(P)-dependent oxidoreductase [Geminicoccaceae bacterium]
MSELVWIAGASYGLGASLARAYARKGASLALSARGADKLEALVDELSADGVRARAFPSMSPMARRRPGPWPKSRPGWDRSPAPSSMPGHTARSTPERSAPKGWQGSSTSI